MMTGSDHPNAPTIYTIGHSNHTLEDFLSLLEAYQIQVLVDARSQPYSKFASHFDSASLKSHLAESAIRYAFLGNELGGRPSGTQFYDADGHVLYEKLAESPQFRAGIARLMERIRENRVALLCSEENPVHCHRRLLVSRVLVEQGVRVCHIRGDGRVQSEDELAADEQTDSGQGNLFEFRPIPEWKSIQSVSPKRQPPSSSER